MSRAAHLLALTTASLVSVLATSARAEDMRTALEARVDGDAAAGRSYFAPTALTGAEGSASMSLRAPLYPALAGSFAYSVTDTFEVSVGGGAIVVIDDEGSHPNRMVGGGFKVQALRTSRAAVALSASVFRRPAYFHTDPFDEGWHEDALLMAELGAVGTTCLDGGCEIVVSAHAHVMPELAGGDMTRLWGGGSLVAGHRRSRLVVDVTMFTDGDGGGFLGYTGYRAARRNVSFDVGALVVSVDNAIVPWPTFGLSTRF